MMQDRFPVSVVLVQRPARSPWLDHVLQVEAVLPGAVDCDPGAVLFQDGETTRLFAGTTAIAAHAGDTKGYKDNIEAPEPAVYVILRRGGDVLGWALLLVTVDPAEAQAHADSGDDLLEAVPMPPEVHRWLAAFVARHHVERRPWKRRRDRADPEALGVRRPPGA